MSQRLQEWVKKAFTVDITGLIKVIIPGVKADNHGKVLEELTEKLLPSLPHDRRGRTFCDLEDHESVKGALSGSGAAIFHCLSEDVTEPLGALAVSQKGVPYKGGRKNPTRIFFLLISPIKESGSHLQTLSRLEALLLNKGFRHSILTASTVEEIMRAVKRESETAKASYTPLSREEVFAELGSNKNGLTEEEAGKRLRLAGPNSLKRVRRGTLLKDFLSNMFLNLFSVLLWAGGAMAFTAGMPELGWAIFLVIIINAVFSFWQEYKAERAVEALERLLPKKVRAIRDGKEREIDATELVPGDLILLEEGEGVSADGRLIEAVDMRVDNSALTGESRPIYKVSEPVADGKAFIWTEIPNLVFAGTSVLSGEGKMVVTATGMDTEIGKVAYLTQAIRAEMSPLQKEMVRITKTVTLLAVALGLGFFFLGYTIAGLTFAQSFIFAIGIIVANVPEGLLPTVTLSLAMGVQRMAGKKAIVKKLSAVETLGSSTVILTDKTGTLTTNQMCVTSLFVNGEVIEVTGSGYEPYGAFLHGGKEITGDDIKRLGMDLLLSGAALCNNASLHPPSKDSRLWTISGDPTEGALLTAAEKAGIALEDLKEKNGRIAHLAFERIRKRMTTVHEAGSTLLKGLMEGEPEGGALAFVKGAPKEILSLSSSICLNGGNLELTDEVRKRVMEANDFMAGRGLRVLAVAYRTLPLEKGASSYTAEAVERGLTFLGLAAMHDPPRPEVRGAVEACGTAGIKVVIATGDYGLTAKAVAGEIGFHPDTKVVTGEELGGMRDGELKETLKKGPVIFARVSPQDKLRVVTALKDNGEVVAMTGDGVNDAPALKKADIGIAMGLRGSDVAKEAAEIVLADDNFASIVEAVREGRAVYSNIKKFVTYIFASNIPEIIPFIAFVLFKIPLPLTVMQILAVDLGTDIFPALALGVEPPEKGVMNEPPRPKGKRLLDLRTLSLAYLFLGPLEAVLALGAFFLAYYLRGWTPGEPMAEGGALYAAATTMTFAGIVATQVGNVFACRTVTESVFSVGLFSNRFVLYGILIEAALAIILIYTPYLNSVFGFAPLTGADWAVLLSFPLVMLLAAEVRKAILRAGKSA